MEVGIAYRVNWNHLCSILCHFCVEFDQAFSHCSSEVYRQNQSYDIIDDDDDDITHEQIEDPEIGPLINYAPRPVTMSTSAKYTKTATNNN